MENFDVWNVRVLIAILLFFLFFFSIKLLKKLGEIKKIHEGSLEILDLSIIYTIWRSKKGDDNAEAQRLKNSIIDKWEQFDLFLSGCAHQYLADITRSITRKFLYKTGITVGTNVKTE